MKIIAWIITLIGSITFLDGLKIRERLINNGRPSGWGGGKAHYDYAAIERQEFTMIIGISIVIVGILLLVIAYKKGGNKISKNRLNSKKCLKCGEISNSSDVYCKNCGNNLNMQGNLVE